jgi:hypothetical protein
LENQIVGGVGSIVGALTDGIRLIVFESDVDRAKEILGE